MNLQRIKPNEKGNPKWYDSIYMTYSKCQHFRSGAPNSDHQQLRTRLEGKKCDTDRCGYKGKTQGILAGIKFFSTLTVVVNTQIYTCEKIV